MCKRRRRPFSGSMALLAIGTYFSEGVVGVSRLVIGIGMASCAGIGGVGIDPLVAGVAVVFDSSVCASEGIELVVVKGRR